MKQEGLHWGCITEQKTHLFLVLAAAGRAELVVLNDAGAGRAAFEIGVICPGTLTK
jgi:hypothetical protein